ncbi:hypothetical protein BFN03_01940 [Rhodococcus sp. WMMA185]|uniref:hypothetical protein n=1 Tax=Rhodococcus sp. WMMA185 TaxID=679318 RepID=UPI000878F0DF|nr:hypothetical protein [Rhodococcus sp. WMMA185]AOW94283.1 hypothetical protein BFN03_01940 [Rhodococcus sp. WMMA185]
MDSEPAGLIWRRTMLAHGYTDGELHRSRTCGALVPVRRGAYLRKDDFTQLDTLGQHRVLAQATALASLSDTAVSHASALALHGIELWNVPLALVHLTVNRNRGGKKSRRRHLHAAPFDPDEVTVIDGITVTTVARSIVDFARTVPFEQAVVSGDHALRLGFTDRRELAEAVARAHHRTGARRAERAVSFMDGLSESVGESRSRVLLHRSGMPRPELQRIVHSLDGRPIGRVDFLWRERGVVGEFDGMGKYAMNSTLTESEAVRNEKRREDELRATGAAVARWTWKHLDDPTSVVARIRRAFEIAGRSAPTLSVSHPPEPLRRAQ